MAAPQSPPGAAGSVGHPWAHRLPGAGPRSRPGQAQGTAPEVAHS